MVVIGNNSGQLGNRLFLFAHFISNAIELKYEVFYPGFYDYAHYFVGTTEDFFCRYPSKKTIIQSNKLLQFMYLRFIIALMFLLKKMKIRGINIELFDIAAMCAEYDLKNLNYNNMTKTVDILFTNGFLFRDYRSFSKNSCQLRNYFEPVDIHVQNVSQLISKARLDCDILIGVHIRQGDYKTWNNGRYFFSSRDYARLMKRCRDSGHFNSVKFLICSNENQNEQVFEGLNYIMGNNHELEDMYAFAQCDYLIGPPSTYTMWASFYGSVPLFMFESIDDPINLDSFQLH